MPGAVHKVRAVGLKGQAAVFLLEGWTPKPDEVKVLGEIRSQ